MALAFDEAAACRRVFEAITRQVDLARLLGLTSAAISNLKRRKKVTLDLIMGAAELTGLSVEWFLFGDRAPEERARRKRSDALSKAVAESMRRSTDLANRMLEEGKATGGDVANLRRLLHLYDERFSALEEWVGWLEKRLRGLDALK